MSQLESKINLYSKGDLAALEKEMNCTVDMEHDIYNPFLEQYFVRVLKDILLTNSKQAQLILFLFCFCDNEDLSDLR